MQCSEWLENEPTPKVRLYEFINFCISVIPIFTGIMKVL